MLQFSRKRFDFFILILLFCLVIPARQSFQAMETADCLGTISLQLSRSLELTLEHVSESIKALADEYAGIYDATPPRWAWGTGIDILIYIIEFACYLYLVCHEKPELMLQVRFTTSSCVELSVEKSFGTMPIATPL